LLAARAAARRYGSQIALEPTGFDGVRIGWAPSALWLVGLGALFGLLARIGTRRLLA
jgi:hypothetical protein